MPRSDYSLDEIDGLIGLIVEVALAEIENEMRAAGAVTSNPAPAGTNDAEPITNAPTAEA